MTVCNRYTATNNKVTWHRRHTFEIWWDLQLSLYYRYTAESMVKITDPTVDCLKCRVRRVTVLLNDEELARDITYGLEELLEQQHVALSGSY